MRLQTAHLTYKEANQGNVGGREGGKEARRRMFNQPHLLNTIQQGSRPKRWQKFGVTTSGL